MNLDHGSIVVLKREYVNDDIPDLRFRVKWVDDPHEDAMGKECVVIHGEWVSDGQECAILKEMINVDATGQLANLILQLPTATASVY